MSGGHKGEGSGRGGGARKRDREQEEEKVEEDADKVARLSARLPRNPQETKGKNSEAAKSDTESDEEEETGAGSKADHDQDSAVKHSTHHSQSPYSSLLCAPCRFSAAARILFVALTPFFFFIRPGNIHTSASYISRTSCVTTTSLLSSSPRFKLPRMHVLCIASHACARMHVLCIATVTMPFQTSPCPRLTCLCQ